jgi:flagellar assembly factor FliW
MIAHIRNLEKSQINNLMTPLKLLEKKNKSIQNVIDRKRYQKFRAEINELDTKKQNKAIQ